MSNPRVDLSGLFPEGSEPAINFEHRFFGSVTDMCFRLSEHTQEPVIALRLANTDTVLSFPGVKKEFKISDDSHDGRMLAVIDEALHYVRGLRIGDPVPKELTTREASWEPSDRHRSIAYQRLTLQLVTWLTGEEHLFTNPEELLQLAEDPAIKKKVNLAFDEAAKTLGLEGHKEDVILHIMDLSREFAYIEALRDVFSGPHGITSVDEKMQALRRLYSSVRGLQETVDQICRLLAMAVKSYREVFEEIDAQTGEILAVLKNVTGQIAYVREQRDLLHEKLMAWEDVLAEWRKIETRRTDDKPDIFRDLYQFLAPRFMQTNEWVLVTKPMGPEELKKLRARSKEQVIFRPGGVMKW